MTGGGERVAPPAGTRAVDQVVRGAALATAVVAAAVIALASDDPRLLRLGVIAALWAALLGAFAVVRLRREATTGADRAQELRRRYRIELEREVAARREHELTVEREARSEAAQQHRDELDALRAELHALRDTLAQLLGGEVLVERVALRAESTRVRSLPEQSRATDHVLEPARAPAPRQVEPAAAQPATRWRPDVTVAAAPLPRRDPDVRTDPTLRRPRPQEPVEPAAVVTQFADDPLFGDAGVTWSSTWEPEATGWGVPAAEPALRPAGNGHERAARVAADPLTGPLTSTAAGGRHQGPRPPTVAPAAQGNGGRRRAPEAAAGVRRGPVSVDELLAAHAAETAPRHRRHRVAD